MPAVTRSTIQVHSFGEQLSTRITLSLTPLFTIQPVKLYTSMILSQPQFTNNVCHAVKNITINQSPTYGGVVTFPKTLFWRPSLNRFVCVCVCVCVRVCVMHKHIWQSKAITTEWSYFLSWHITVWAKKVCFGAQCNVHDIKVSRHLLDFHLEAKYIRGWYIFISLVGGKSEVCPHFCDMQKGTFTFHFFLSPSLSLAHVPPWAFPILGECDL